MSELNQKHIQEIVGLIMEETKNPTVTALESFEMLGEEFVENEMEGRSSEEIKMGKLFAKNMSRIKVLEGILTASTVDPKAVKDPTGKMHIIQVNPKYLTLYPAAVRDTLIINNYLDNNFEILFEELYV